MVHKTETIVNTFFKLSADTILKLYLDIYVKSVYDKLSYTITKEKYTQNFGFPRVFEYIPLSPNTLVLQLF